MDVCCGVTRSSGSSKFVDGRAKKFVDTDGQGRFRCEECGAVVPGTHYGWCETIRDIEPDPSRIADRRLIKQKTKATRRRRRAMKRKPGQKTGQDESSRSSRPNTPPDVETGFFSEAETEIIDALVEDYNMKPKTIRRLLQKPHAVMVATEFRTSMRGPEATDLFERWLKETLQARDAQNRAAREARANKPEPDKRPSGESKAATSTTRSHRHLEE